MSEDCLFLDVYVPKQAFGIKQPVPVVVWFYGGAYLFGSKSQYDPSIMPFYDGKGPLNVATTANKDKTSMIFVRGLVQLSFHDINRQTSKLMDSQKLSTRCLWLARRQLHGGQWTAKCRPPRPACHSTVCQSEYPWCKRQSLRCVCLGRICRRIVHHAPHGDASECQRTTFPKGDFAESGFPMALESEGRAQYYIYRFCTGCSKECKLQGCRHGMSTICRLDHVGEGQSKNLSEESMRRHYPCWTGCG